MTTTKFSRNEVNSLLMLLLPLVLNEFLNAAVGFSSNIFLARLGTQELAAGAVAIWIFITMMVVLWGTLCSVSVLVAQKFGEKNHAAIAEILRDGLILALLVSIPTVLLLRNIGPLLLLAGQDSVTASLGASYMKALSWGMMPDFVALVLMQFLIGMGHARTTMVFTLFWVPINILCNYAFTFGKFGFPALGMAGIGWGTSLTFALLAVGLIIYLVLNSNYRKYFEKALHWGKPEYLLELCQIGLPMGSMFCIEIGFFLTLTLLMGYWNTTLLAANQITLQFVGQVSIVSFAVAQAITVRIGHTLGANQPHLAERAGYIGVTMSFGFMFLIALFYWFFPETLLSIDLNLQNPNNAAIIHYAKQFLAIAALFQLIETVRFGLFGALRGLKDTRFTLLVSIFSFWGVSLPLGYLLATVFHLSGAGLWWGMVVGQICGTVLLYMRFRYKVRAMYRSSLHVMPVKSTLA
jgi:multidrug resistance protein, MATE family